MREPGQAPMTLRRLLLRVVVAVSPAVMPTTAPAKDNTLDIIHATQEVESWMTARAPHWNHPKMVQIKGALQNLETGLLQIAASKRLVGEQFSRSELLQKKFLEAHARAIEQGLHRVKAAIDKLDSHWRSRNIDDVVALSNALWSRNTRDTEFKSFSSYRISSAGGFRFAGKIHDFKAFRKTRRQEARQLDALTKKIDATIHKTSIAGGSR